jgi:predicted nucleotidyltransferase
MVAEPITSIIQKYLRQLSGAGMGIAYGVVFGSQVGGAPNEWSDIDLVVVSDRFDGPYTRNDVQQLWRMAARVDSRIEPIAAGVKEFEENDTRAILEIARREGEKVYLEEVATA